MAYLLPDAQVQKGMRARASAMTETTANTLHSMFLHGECPREIRKNLRSSSIIVAEQEGTVQGHLCIRDEGDSGRSTNFQSSEIFTMRAETITY